MRDVPTVSVIIPVYNDAEGLELCLAALGCQTYPGEAFEVLVVDNGSTDDVGSVVKLYDHASLLYEPQRGSYAARNHGIDNASGEIIAFTDADCIPHSFWLEKGVECLTSTKNCGLVAGKVQLESDQPNEPTPYERYDHLTYLKQVSAVNCGRYGATANLFTTRKVIEAVGKFDASLVSGGDNDWGKRVHHHGFQQAYCAEAVVRHPARNSFRALLRKELRLAGGLAQVDLKQDLRRESKQEVSLFDRMQRSSQPIRNALGVIIGSTSAQIPSLIDRVLLGVIILTLHLVRQLERLRVKLGGQPLNL